MDTTLDQSPVLVTSLRVAEVVRELLMDPALHLLTLANAIRVEPEVSAALLRMANGAALMHDEPVVELDRAIAMIGTAQVRVVAIQVVMRQLVEGLPTAAARSVAERVWEHSVEVACLAEQIGRGHGLRSDYCHTLGLLHDLPVFAFLNSARTNPTAFANEQSIQAAASNFTAPTAAQLARELGVPDTFVADLVQLDGINGYSDAADAIRTAHGCVSTTHELDRFRQRAMCDAMRGLMDEAKRRKDELLDLVRMY